MGAVLRPKVSMVAENRDALKHEQEVLEVVPVQLSRQKALCWSLLVVVGEADIALGHQTEELEEKISKFRIDVDTVQGRMLYKSRVTSN